MEGRRYPTPVIAGGGSIFLTLGLFILALVLNSYDTENIKTKEITVIIIDMIAAMFGTLSVWILMPIEITRKVQFLGSLLLLIAATINLISEFKASDDK